MVRQAPFRHNRAAARDDAGHALGRQRHIFQQHTGMDGEIIDTLLGLLDKRVAEHLPSQFLGLAIDFFQRLINRHRADGHRRVSQNPFAGLVNMFAGGEVHNRVGPPANAPTHFIDLLTNRRGDGAIADIAVHFDEEIAPDNHRFAFGMVDIGRNNGATARHFLAHKFGRYLGDKIGTKSFAAMLARQHRGHFLRHAPPFFAARG